MALVKNKFIPQTVQIRKGQSVRLIGAKYAGQGVLCFHGGGGVAGTPAMMDDFIQCLVAQHDVRVALPEYKVLDNAPQSRLPDMLDDATAALAWAKKSFPNGVWVAGASFGGLLALHAVFEAPEGVNGLLLLNPVTNTGEGGFANRVIDPTQHAGLSPLDRYRNSPILDKMPCLIIHGKDDDVVPLHTSKDFAALWHKAHCRLIAVPKMGHGFFNRPPQAEKTADKVGKFMQRNRPQNGVAFPKNVKLVCCVGAQKAGTSWLYDQVSKSPQVYSTSVKERHYFDVLWLNEGATFFEPKVKALKQLAKEVTSDHDVANATRLRSISSLTQQLAPFAAEHGDHSAYIKAMTEGRKRARVVCDFTPSYCGLSAKHFSQIDALGDVRFIYILREPVARMWSQIRMKYKVMGVPDLAKRCAEHAHEMCDNGTMKKIFRADYARTLSALDRGAKNVKILFYETLFQQNTFDEVADFIGIDPITIDSDTKVNEGRPAALDPFLEQKMLRALAPQYEMVMDRFGTDLPEEWITRYNHLDTSQPEQPALPQQKPVKITGRVIGAIKRRLHTQKTERQIVFLHIPKTAGQSIVKELRRACGSAQMSPVRTHSQAAKDAQLPKGYHVYAGHIDWVDLETLDDDRFSFSVLRSPRERLASFYFYLKREAEAMSPENLALKENTGKRTLLAGSVDQYFFGGDNAWQKFIHDHYSNFYCSYFATQRIRGWHQIQNLEPEALLGRATKGAGAVTKLYGLTKLHLLEADLSEILNTPIDLRTTRVNTGPPPKTTGRWDDLMALFEDEKSREKIENFVRLDEDFLRRVGMDSELS